jgi:NADH-quinone oxidoreductase subunit J
MGVGAAGLYVLLSRDERRYRIGASLLLAAGLAGTLVFFIAHSSQAGRSAGVFFYILAAIGLAAGVRVVTHRRPVYAVLYFVLVILSSAGLVLLAGAQFLAAALVIIYAGAIVVTYVFVLMLAQQSRTPAPYDNAAREPLAAVFLGFLLCATLSGAVLDASTERVSPKPIPSSEGHVAAVGESLLTEFAVGLETAGLLLLVAMVGAIAIAARPSTPQGDSEEEQEHG